MFVLGLLVFFIAGEYRSLGTLMMFTSIMLWVYRLFLRKWANSFQTKTLVKLENWYERNLRRALSGKMPYILTAGTFLLLILSFITFGARRWLCLLPKQPAWLSGSHFPAFVRASSVARLWYRWSFCPT